ncbi:hypothetical protein ACEK06_04710 [Pseudomonas brenneri]|uniref:hypothetical protein n=1 Tax=Pseudomonas brenneri TaxID=129817 RepID=UPI0035711F8E
MATTVQAKFKGSKHNKTSNISAEDLPNKGDFLNMDGETSEVTKKTFHYNPDGTVAFISYDLA